jgi:hypothetical protein
LLVGIDVLRCTLILGGVAHDADAAGLSQADDCRAERAERITAYDRRRAGMVIAVDGESIVYEIDIEKSTARRLQMLTGGHRRRPH